MRKLLNTTLLFIVSRYHFHGTNKWRCDGHTNLKSYLMDEITVFYLSFGFAFAIKLKNVSSNTYKIQLI